MRGDIICLECEEVYEEGQSKRVQRLSSQNLRMLRIINGQDAGKPTEKRANIHSFVVQLASSWGLADPAFGRRLGDLELFACPYCVSH